MREKISYGLGTCIDMWGHWLYPSLAQAVFLVYLGLDAKWVGLAIGLIRFIDIISDPLAGWISDNTRTRFGRRRPLILIGGTLAGVGLPALFLIPGGIVHSQTLGAPDLFWFMVLSNLIYIPIVSLVNMPYQSLGVELTPDYKERTSIMAVRNLMQKVFESAFFVATGFLTLSWFNDAETGRPNPIIGAQTYCALLGAIMIIASVIIFFNVKERYYAKVQMENRQDARNANGFWKNFGQNLRCRPYRILLSKGFAFCVGTGMVQSLGYIATVYYVAGGDDVVGNRWNSAMGPSYAVGGALGAALFGWVGRYLDKKTTIIAACGWGVVAFGTTWFTYNPAFPWLQLLASGSIGMCNAGFWMLNNSMLADVIDHDEFETGRRREGALASMNSWVLKAGNSFGAMASGFILSATGFVSGQKIQAADTLTTMRLVLALVPIAGIVLTIIIALRYPLTREVVLELRTLLEKRRGAVS
ncbi:MAG: MFS transporter [Opitutaceae bacterium]|nr:MFS transporter [Opitutaceae bacterium]